MKCSEVAYIGLGSNKGDRYAYLQAAVDAFQSCETIGDVRVSPVYESEAHTRHPEDSRSPYLNAVVRFRTTFLPDELLKFLQRVERRAGREQNVSDRWEARTLDLDLLIYDRLTHESEHLTLPHPCIGERRFVLQPLVDLAPSCQVPPPFSAETSDLLEACTDSHGLRKTAFILEK